MVDIGIGGKMSFSNALYFEINIFCIAIIILVLIKSSDRRQMIAQRIFDRAMISMIIFIMADLYSFLMLHGTLEINSDVVMICKSVYFLATTVMCAIWRIYFRFLENSDYGKKKHPEALTGVIVLIQLVMTIVNYEKGFFFSVDQNYQYYRGWLFVLQYLFAYGFILVAVLEMICSAFQQKRYVDRDNMISMTLFPIFRQWQASCSSIILKCHWRHRP